MKKQPWLFLIGLLLAAGSHSVLANRSAAEPASASELPRGNAQSPAYPKEWREFKEKMEKVHQAFEAHIKGAKNITVPIARKEFEWEVDWDAQQAYCKGIAKAIFSKPREAQFAWPDAMAARDGVEKVYDAIGKTFPRCQAPKPTTDEIFLLMNLGLPDPLHRGHLRTLQSTWRKEAWLEKINRNALGLAYFTGKDVVVEMFFVSPDELKKRGSTFSSGKRAPRFSISQWNSSSWEDITTGCPSGGPGSGPGKDPSNELGYTDYLPTVFLQIDSQLVPIEFGRYAYRERSQRGALTYTHERWGMAGEKFLFVKSLTHSFWKDWAKSPLPPDFVDEPDHDLRPGQDRACVINFE